MSNESAPQGYESPQLPQASEVKYTVTRIDGRSPHGCTFRIEPPMSVGPLFLEGIVGDTHHSVLEAKYTAENAQGTYIAVVTGTLALEATARAFDAVHKRIRVLANNPEKALDMSAAQIMSNGQFRPPF